MQATTNPVARHVFGLAAIVRQMQLELQAAIDKNERMNEFNLSQWLDAATVLTEAAAELCAAPDEAAARAIGKMVRQGK